MPMLHAGKHAGKRKRRNVRASNISEFLSAHPRGRSKKAMSKEGAQKQAIAAALETERRDKEDGGKRGRGHKRSKRRRSRASSRR